MFVSKLHLDHFGRLEHFETAFRSHSVLFTGEGSKAVAEAIQLLCGNRFPLSRQLQATSRLYAEIETDRLYRVEAAGGTLFVPELQSQPQDWDAYLVEAN